jgi:tRNA threonylcarbamoyladenosine biosynthesis protein TsaE
MTSLALWLPDAAATERLGEVLGGTLSAGDVVALVGDLGAGKTCLVRGLARGLRVADPDAVASPTYLLAIEHPGPVPLLHMDAYLPGKLEAFLADGGLDYLSDNRFVVAIEWGDRLRSVLPPHTLWLALSWHCHGGVEGRRADLEGALPLRMTDVLRQTFVDL